MSSPQGVRQRQKDGSTKKRGTTPNPDASLMNGNVDDTMEKVKQAGKEAATRDWDYKLALAVITVLAFLTRFWGISHPDQVVFDEVHFGKVCEHGTGRRFDKSVVVGRHGLGRR